MFSLLIFKSFKDPRLHRNITKKKSHRLQLFIVLLSTLAGAWVNVKMDGFQ